MEDKEFKVTSSVNIEVVKGDRRYVFSVPVGAPFGESYDAAFQAMDVISTWHAKAQDQMKAARPNDDVAEVAEEVVTETV